MGRAYLVTIGVSAFENEAWDLTYAANDARQLGRTLLEHLSSVDPGTPGKRYEEVVWVPLISEATWERGQRRMLTNHATKDRIRAVLEKLSGQQVEPKLLQGIPNTERLAPARPEDLVLIAFSTHGDVDRGRFYFLPHDIGSGSDRTLRPELLQRAIWSDELSRWLYGLDAMDLVMIVDACHSAATVQETGFKPGPMGSRGLGQLSYDKGMRILAATQADDVALESARIRQGLLTYALVHDGLEAGQADFKPKDRTILLTEWLQYAEQRVPSLYSEIRSGQLHDFGDAGHTKGVRILRPSGASSLDRNAPSLQRPALFDFARRQRETILLRLRP